MKDIDKKDEKQVSGGETIPGPSPWPHPRIEEPIPVDPYPGDPYPRDPMTPVDPWVSDPPRTDRQY